MVGSKGDGLARTGLAFYLGVGERFALVRAFLGVGRGEQQQ